MRFDDERKAVATDTGVLRVGSVVRHREFGLLGIVRGLWRRNVGGARSIYFANVEWHDKGRRWTDAMVLREIEITDVDVVTLLATLEGEA